MIWEGWNNYQKRNISLMIVDINASIDRLEAMRCGEVVRDKFVEKTCYEESVKGKDEEDEELYA